MLRSRWIDSYGGVLGNRSFPPGLKCDFRPLPCDLPQVCQRWLGVRRLRLRTSCLGQLIGLVVARDIGVAGYLAHLHGAVCRSKRLEFEKDLLRRIGGCPSQAGGGCEIVKADYDVLCRRVRVA